jgi:adenosylcobinamide-GDP ribazoletransferase
MRRELAALRAAVTFFTRVPLPSSTRWDPEDLQRAAAWFPWVGALVGAVAAAAWWLAREAAGLSPELASGLSLAASVLVTGAFHEDGWADVCDGFGGGLTKEGTLTIMKDSRLGTYGVVGLILMLGLKWQALAALPSAVVPAALVGMHVASRAASGCLIAALPYVSEAGKSKPLARRLGSGRLLWVVATGSAALALLPADCRFSVAAGMILSMAGMGRWFWSRIGGYTGDCLGAAQQVGELTGWLILAGATGR